MLGLILTVPSYKRMIFRRISDSNGTEGLNPAVTLTSGPTKPRNRIFARQGFQEDGKGVTEVSGSLSIEVRIGGDSFRTLVIHVRTQSTPLNVAWTGPDG